MNNSGFARLLILLTTISAVIVGAAAAKMLLQTGVNETRGKLLVGMSIAIIIMLVIEFIYLGRSTKSIIAKTVSQFNKNEKESLMNFPAPALVLDKENCIIWYNKLFGSGVYTEQEAYGLNIGEIFEIDLDKVYSKDGFVLPYNGRYYIVRAIKTESADPEMRTLYFQDKTDLIELETERNDSRQSVIIISIDNYDELLQNIRESEKAHILVSLERLIENFTEGTTGISRRAGNDKFYVILEERHLRPIIEKRFEILEQARQIKIDERTALTLSIGVGHEAASLAESERFAKQALEMCLGRGGDQAAVHNESGYEFYGGVSKSMSKNTRVKSRMVAKVLGEIIAAHERVLIMGHRFGDLDSVGAATGLCEAIKCMGKECYVVVDREENLSKLMIKYVEENTIKNYYITPEEGLAKVTDESLLIVCDTHNPSIVDSPAVLERSKHRVVIDHHRLIVKPIENTELFYHEPSASSACEMVAELLEYFPDVKIPSYVADAVLAGIMLDTKYFVMNTGVRTFEAAAYLKKIGADTIAVKKLFANSLDTYRSKAEIVNSAEIYRKCAIAMAVNPSENIRISSAKAADEMLEIAGVNASFVLFYTGRENEINISARSLGQYNVQLIMESLGGGGHHTMAACQIHEDNLEAAKRRLIEAINEYIRNT